MCESFSCDLLFGCCCVGGPASWRRCRYIRTPTHTLHTETAGLFGGCDGVAECGSGKQDVDFLVFTRGLLGDTAVPLLARKLPSTVHVLEAVPASCPDDVLPALPGRDSSGGGSFVRAAAAPRSGGHCNRGRRQSRRRNFQPRFYTKM